MLEKLKNNGVTGMQLKVLAMVSMTIDHTGAVLFPWCMWMRAVGRLAFPIYCFLLTEGFHYTRNRRRYLARLFVFAFISEIPFDLAFYGRILDFRHQNIFFTLFIGFLTMYFCEFASSDLSKYIMCFAGMLLAAMLKTDYSFLGVATILIFYLFRDQKFMAFLLQAIMHISGFTIQSFAVSALIPIGLYKGKQGKKRFQIGFYAYYPVHLLVLFLVSRII